MTNPGIELIPLDRALIGLLLDNAVSVYPGCAVSPDDRPVVRDVARRTQDFYEKRRLDPNWGGFLVADAATRLVVGTCAYEGGPEVDLTAGGTHIEISYYTFPAHQGRGYATAMASALVIRAASTRRVETTRGPHTSGTKRVRACARKNGLPTSGRREQSERGSPLALAAAGRVKSISEMRKRG